MTYSDSRRYYLANPEETESLAVRLADLAKAGDFFALYGELGSGKTHFARAFIRRLAGSEQEVPSPTFTLVQYYEGRKGGKSLPICHADFYRLAGEEEVLELGLEEFDGIVLAEWPERMGRHLPHHALRLCFSTGDQEEARQVLLEGSATWNARLNGMGE